MSEARNICLVEDDTIMGQSLVDRFALEGMTVDWFDTIADAYHGIREGSYRLVICDIRLGDGDGEQLFTRLRETVIDLPGFIFITGYGSVDRAVRLLKLGARDYLTKPFDIDELIERIQALLPERGDSSDPHRLGVSAAMRRIEALLPQLARKAATILITGESGVGKEHVARLLHELRDPAAPFVAINCSALAESVMEAELFGYEKGAFTGALRTKPGLFEQADGGTLLLDEIADMPHSMQSKILRVIQDRAVTRVGGEATIQTEFRLIAACNRDLVGEVQAGRFREDLFYRINVVHLRIPPLRERRDDIAWFAHQFVELYAREADDEAKRLAPELELELQAMPWPGNVRELKHAIERACILTPGPTVHTLFPDDLAQADIPADEGPGQQLSLRQYVEQAERKLISRTLERYGGRITDSANALGISRKNLWEKIRKLDISTDGQG